MARSFFLWCTVINYGLLLVWALLFMFARDGFFRLWSKWDRVSPEQFELLNVARTAQRRWDHALQDGHLPVQPGSVHCFIYYSMKI
jgi:hypothetical protein